MKDIREINGSRGVNRTETEAGNFVRGTSLDLSDKRDVIHLELSESWCGMYIRGCTNYKVSCTFFYPLKFRDQ